MGALCVQMSGWQGARALHAEEGHAVVYKGMVDCFVRTVREEGFRALFKVTLQFCDVLHLLIRWGMQITGAALMLPCVWRNEDAC
jgi:hypothetical protein